MRTSEVNSVSFGGAAAMPSDALVSHMSVPFQSDALSSGSHSVTAQSAQEEVRTGLPAMESPETGSTTLRMRRKPRVGVVMGDRDLAAKSAEH